MVYSANNRAQKKKDRGMIKTRRGTETGIGKKEGKWIKTRKEIWTLQRRGKTQGHCKDKARNRNRDSDRDREGDKDKGKNGRMTKTRTDTETEKDIGTGTGA